MTPMEESLPEHLPRLYTELADWWHLLSAPQDYAEEAAFFYSAFLEFSKTPPKTVLELGSGGGNNASHLKEHFQMTLVDRSAEMLAISRKLNPTCEHIQADMRTLALGRTFDAVFIHDAIMYCTTLRDLRRTLETAYHHCKAEGVLLVVPDFIRETFDEKTEHGGHDSKKRAARYLSWTHDPDPNDTTYVMDFVYLLRDAKGNVRSVYDRHVLGLFSQHEWLSSLSEVGFEPKMIQDPFNRVVFVGVRCQD